MRRLLLTSLAVTLVATGVVQSSLAAFTSTSASTGRVTASSDWTPPTVVLRQPAAVLRGSVTITADATDGETRVAQVVHQRRLVGTTAWTDICTVTATGSVFACNFATTTVADGRYELRSVATDAEGNVAASALRTTTIDNLAPVVEIDDSLADAVRGTVTIDVTATDAGSGVASVRLQRSPADANSWTDVCTDTTAPYSCTLVTTNLPNGDLDLRAIATDAVGNTATSAILTTTVDNLAPSVSVNPPSGTLSGTLTIAATASDAHSGIASVTVQHRLVGQTTWTTLCVDTTAPYGCRFDTTQVPAGNYDFRAIAVDEAGNSTTSAIQQRPVSNVAASVSVEDPGEFLRGTVEVDVNANAPLGIRNVQLQYRATGTTGAWITICTDTTSPYSCSWDTTQVATGGYDLRAILTDNNGATTTSVTVANRKVDNAPLRGLDVQATNGGRIGWIDTGDTLSWTWSQELDLTTLLAGWDGSPRAVTARVRDGKSLGAGSNDDTLDVFAGTGTGSPVRLGTTNLRGDYVKGGKTVLIAGTMTADEVIVDGQTRTVITLRIDQTPTVDVRAAKGTPTMIWSPVAGVRDVSGAANSTTPVQEQGAADRDL